MSATTVLILMLFAHIVDDFYLQGVLAKMKQRDWWYSDQANTPLAKDGYKTKTLPGYRDIDSMYERDYIAALIVHALSWAIMISLPILYASAWHPHWAIYLMLGINVAIHAVVDNLKANKHKINLIADQTIHLVQITAVWCVWAFAL